MARKGAARYEASVLWVLLTALLCGCSLGVSPAAFEGPPPGEEGALPSVDRCGYRLPSADPCGACQAEKCCEELTACPGDPECDKMVGCLARCARLDADASCRTDCLVESSPPPAGPIGGVLQCLGSQCEAQCGGCSGMNFMAGRTCGECLSRANACDPLTACLSDEVCRSGYVCGVTCGDPACISRCGLDLSEQTLAQIRELFDRVKAGCAGACALGRAWDCAGTFSWGTVIDTGLVPWTLRLQDGTSQTPAAGLRVRACRNADIRCDNPIATQETDAQGVVTLMVPVTAATEGFDGVVLIDGTVTGQDEAIMPLVFQDDQPLIEPRINKLLVVTPSELTDLAAAVGVEGGADPQAAQVGVLARDCTSNAASDVRMTVEVSGRSYDGLYLSGNIPDPTSGQTDGSGTALFYNVAVTGDQPLIGVITGVDAATGEVRRRRPIGVRRGWLSTVLLMPGPAE